METKYTPRKYERSGRSYEAQRRCRLSLRRGGTELAVIFPSEVAKQAGIEIGKRLDLFFSERELIFVPAEGGTFAVRKQESGTITYPYVLVPVGPEEPFSIQCEAAPCTCDHEIDPSGRLIIHLPASMQKKDNEKQETSE